MLFRDFPRATPITFATFLALLWLMDPSLKMITFVAFHQLFAYFRLKSKSRFTDVRSHHGWQNRPTTPSTPHRVTRGLATGSGSLVIYPTPTTADLAALFTITTDADVLSSFDHHGTRVLSIL